MSLPITVSPEGSGYRVRIADGSSGMVYSGGVFAPDNATALSVVAQLLGVPDLAPVQVESNVLTAMKERLGQ